MKALDFNYGRLSFSAEKLEMLPCLPDTVELKIHLFLISKDGLYESGFHEFSQLEKEKLDGSVVWLHITGLASDEFWKELKRFLETGDEEIKWLKSPHRQSFFEEIDNGLFWSLQRPSATNNADALETVNFLLAEKVLVTRQFSHDNAFSMATHKLMSRGPALAELGTDRLAAILIHDILQSYMSMLKLGGTKLESIQNKIIKNPGKAELELINRSQQIIWIYLNALWPVETVVQGILHSRSKLLSDDGLKDMKARLNESDSVLRLFETYRAMSYDLMDVYVSGLGLKTNETTMVLTVIATLFLPPSLIAGIYGMNFQIPEVNVAGGYYLCLASMFAVSGSLLFWLYKRGYIRF